ncbi:YihY/virulence factor BrkB family protein [Sphingosinicella sp. LHD-64]|uniref:YihY/virulence factor BrkB family protein n=1 Tax=Sphingosinicella sp. LHD-64 TaxID=3072139 RepID=UPI00280D4F8A|nr:YihY/virulence factor BrkB family protein [Sphingosinicella sp. LHD-64]MDQ8758041.1 YihY/virulence factor BrkB family protein [Sphingosinicella sp. LHD-64]
MNDTNAPAPPLKAQAEAEAIEHEVHDQFAAKGRSPHSPEARREAAIRTERALRRQGAWRRHVGPGTRPFRIARRVLVGAYYDGFIHAGNLAYLALIALFPFFITATAVMSALGQTAEGEHALEVILATMPPGVAETLGPPVREAMSARTGPLLWLGAAVGLWTVGSLIETIRDILRRAYGTQFTRSFWHYRLYSIGLIVGAVVLLLISFSAQVVTTAVSEFIERVLPEEVDAVFQIALSRGISAFGLFLSLYLLFYTLTPSRYRQRRYPKWPGALATTIWWVAVTLALPPLLAGLLSYDLTYGSLAGVMVVLFFFYLVGLGVVIGAELNAALAESPMEHHDDVGQADDRMHKEA